MKIKWIVCLALAASAVANLAAAPRQEDDFTKNLIKVGTKSDNFSLMKPDGTKLDLYEAAKGHKAVIVNFWFYH